MGFSARYTQSATNAIIAGATSVDIPETGAPALGLRYDVKFYNQDGHLDSPDATTFYARVIRPDGTAVDVSLRDMLYNSQAFAVAANSAGELVDSTDATGNFPAASEWVKGTVTSGAASIYVRVPADTGSGSPGAAEWTNVNLSGFGQGVYTLELGWFEQARAYQATYRIHVGESEVAFDEVRSIKAVTDLLPNAGALTTIGTNASTAAIKSTAAAASAAAVESDWANGGRLDNILDARASQASVDTVDTVVDTILVDTAELQTDWANGGRLDNILDARASQASVDTVDTVVDTILVDTNELQTDWVNGGRLDLIVDELTVQGDTNETAILRVEADTQDIQTKIGSPTAGSVAATLDHATYGLNALDTDLSTILTAVQAVQNNTRFVATVPQKLNRPGGASSGSLEVMSFLYDSAGNMETPDDDEVMVRLRASDGTYITNRTFTNRNSATALSAATDTTAWPAASGWRALQKEANGKYFFFLKSTSADPEEAINFEFGWEEASVKIYQARTLQISDAADLDTIGTNVDAVLADTNELQTDWVNGGRLDNILDARASQATADTILADTNELQTDWVNGGRLDNILDARASQATADTILADTNELQTDWANGGRLDNILDARASQTSVDTVDTVVDTILANLAAVATDIDGLENAVGVQKTQFTSYPYNGLSGLLQNDPTEVTSGSFYPVTSSVSYRVQSVQPITFNENVGQILAIDHMFATLKCAVSGSGTDPNGTIAWYVAPGGSNPTTGQYVDTIAGAIQISSAKTYFATESTHIVSGLVKSSAFPALITWSSSANAMCFYLICAGKLVAGSNGSLRVSPYDSTALEITYGRN